MCSASSATQTGRAHTVRASQLTWCCRKLRPLSQQAGGRRRGRSFTVTWDTAQTQVDLRGRGKGRRRGGASLKNRTGDSLLWGRWSRSGTHEIPLGGADLSPPSFPFSLPHSSPHLSLMHSFALLSLHTHSFAISFVASLHSLALFHAFIYSSLTFLTSLLPPSLIHLPVSSVIHFLISPCFISFPSSLSYSSHTTFLVPSSLLPCLHLSIAPTLVHSVFLSFLPLLSEFVPLSLISSLPYSLAQASLPCFFSHSTFLRRTRHQKVAHPMLAVERVDERRLYEQVFIFLFSETLE